MTIEQRCLVCGDLMDSFDVNIEGPNEVIGGTCDDCHYTLLEEKHLPGL